MQIAKSTNYALRTLLYASSRSDQLITQAEIAEFFQISREHLRKIVHELSKSGYLETKRGKSGGFKLATPANTISIGEIVRLFEKQEGEIVACVAMDCALNDMCQLKNVLCQAENSFFEKLDSYSIADVVTPAMNRILLKSLSVDSDVLLD